MVQLQQHCLNNTSVMHPGHISVITCPTPSHSSIKDTLTCGGNVLQQLWGNKEAIPAKAGGWELWCVEPQKCRQGSEPTVTPLCHPPGPVGRFCAPMAMLSLCTQRVYLLCTNLEREYFQKHLLWSQHSLPAPGFSIPQYFKLKLFKGMWDVPGSVFLMGADTASTGNQMGSSPQTRRLIKKHNWQWQIA